MLKTNQIELTDNEKEIFGDFDQAEAKRNYEARQPQREQAAAEMSAFIESLPVWVNENDYFSLYMMSEKERAHWLMEHSPYIQKQLTPSRPVEKIAGVRI